MKDVILCLNGLFGIIVSVYANMDIGKPKRLRSLTFLGYMERFFHLTHISLGLATLTFAAGFFARTHGTQKTRFTSLYSHLLALTITAECFVCLLFWALWMIDAKNVVMVENYVGEDCISLFFNLCMHGIPCIFLLVEFFLSDFTSSTVHYLILFVFFILYLVVMWVFRKRTGIWPYEIVNKYKFPYNMVFFLYCFLMICVIYAILSYVHKSFNYRELGRAPEVEEWMEGKRKVD